MDTDILIDTAAIAVRLSQFVDYLEEGEVLQLMRNLLGQYYKSPFWEALDNPKSLEIEVNDAGERVLVADDFRYNIDTDNLSTKE